MSRWALENNRDGLTRWVENDRLPVFWGEVLDVAYPAILGLATVSRLS